MRANVYGNIMESKPVSLSSPLDTYLEAINGYTDGVQRTGTCSYTLVALSNIDSVSDKLEFVDLYNGLFDLHLSWLKFPYRMDPSGDRSLISWHARWSIN